ncbi:mycothiol transferase, partial [Actinoplanes nipponensis]
VDHQAYADNFALRDDETIEDVIAYYDRVAARTEKTVAGIADLNQDVPVDHSAPWNPPDLDNWSVRWVLLHLIQETARHAGHADIIREAVDGATAYPLMAAAEGWPESPWMKPWKPGA